MPIMTALALASAGLNVYNAYQSKPKKQDYVPHGAAYERWLNHLKSQSAESTLYHQAMRPQLRQIGAQTQQANRGIEQFSARNKPGGGVEAQMRMGVNQQALQAMGIAHDKAFGLQQQQNEQTGNQLQQISMEEERGLQQYKSAKDQWTKGLFATAAQAGLSVASAYGDAAAARRRGTGGGGGGTGTVVKTAAELDADYNALPDAVKANKTRLQYGQEVAAQSTSTVANAVEPTRDNISQKRGAVKAARKHLKQYAKGEEGYDSAKSMYESAKENLRTTKKEYGTAMTDYRASQQPGMDGTITTPQVGARVGGAPEFAGSEDLVSDAYSKWLTTQQEGKDAFVADKEKEVKLKTSALNAASSVDVIRNGDEETTLSELNNAYESGTILSSDFDKVITAALDKIKPEDPKNPYMHRLLTGWLNKSQDQVRKALVDIASDPNISDTMFKESYRMGVSFYNNLLAQANSSGTNATTKKQIQFQVNKMNTLYTVQSMVRWGNYSIRKPDSAAGVKMENIENLMLTPEMKAQFRQNVNKVAEDKAEKSLEGFYDILKKTKTSMSRMEADGALNKFIDYLSAIETTADGNIEAGSSTDVIKSVRATGKGDESKLTTKGSALLTVYKEVQKMLEEMVMGIPTEDATTQLGFTYDWED